MRTFKLIAAALLIGAAPLAHAQSSTLKNAEASTLKAAETERDAAKACADMARAKATLLTKELALNEEQAAKVSALLLKNEESLVGMRGHCEVMDAKAKKQDEATYASIRELLGPEQQEKMAELQASGKLEACGKEGGKACCAGKKQAKTERAAVKDAAAPAKKSVR